LPPQTSLWPAFQCPAWHLREQYLHRTQGIIFNRDNSIIVVRPIVASRIRLFPSFQYSSNQVSTPPHTHTPSQSHPPATAHQVDGRMDERMGGWMDGWMHVCEDAWMGGYIDGRMDGRTDVCEDGWTDGCMGGWMTHTRSGQMIVAEHGP